MVHNKQRYEHFCSEHPEIPLFMQAWWLNAVTVPVGKDWNALFVEENGEIVAVMPYHSLRKWGFTVVIQPQLTQHNGVWIDYRKEQKLHKRYSFEKRVMNSLVDQLEALKISFYSQNFHHSFTNWQPFYWRGFEQSTRYTYMIRNIADLDSVFENISPKYRKQIRKGEQDFEVDYDLQPEEFFDFHQKMLLKKNDKISYSKNLFLSIYQATTARNQGEIIAIRDKNRELLSALFVVWDENTAYNLIATRQKNDEGNTALIFMIWTAMQSLSGTTKNYDFEGSMIEGVAARNQQFGAEQVPYFTITKRYSKIFDILQKIKK
ncbi:MAG: methicillin resistance protein [Bacteroidetes bacterium]|nr:methicillin resistance protein [Bacteroidota bacterium]